mgnify:CR=1 FL=1
MNKQRRDITGKGVAGATATCNEQHDILGLHPLEFDRFGSQTESRGATSSPTKRVVFTTPGRLKGRLRP